MWSKSHNQCKSCSTTDWEHSAKGFCYKCYPIVKSIETIKKYDLNDKNSLKEIPGFNKVALNQIVNSGHFEKSKEEILRQLKNRLNLYKNCFNPENTNGMSMERVLAECAEIIIGEKANGMFHGSCAIYDDNFTTEQLKIIFKDLNQILARRRFELNLNKILLLR